MLQRFRRHRLARQHAADFARSRVAGQLFDLGHGSALHFALLHGIVMIGESGHLRQMRDAQHLVRCRELLQPPPHRFRHAAADAGIDLVEHQCPRHAVRALGRRARADVFSASAIRDSSPPDATLSSARGSSPALAEIRNSTRSAPCADQFAALAPRSETPRFPAPANPFSLHLLRQFLRGGLASLGQRRGALRDTPRSPAPAPAPASPCVRPAVSTASILLRTSSRNASTSARRGSVLALQSLDQRQPRLDFSSRSGSASSLSR